MKKQILLILFIISGFNAYNQTLFEFNSNGDIDPNPNVIELEYSDIDIYQKVIDWINLNFKNPDFVLKGKSEDNFLRFSGIEKNLSNYKSMGVYMNYDLFYTIRIDFKESKYRITIENAYLKEGNYVLNNEKIMDFAKGKKMKRAMTEYSKKSIIYLNQINKSIYNYVTGKTENQDDW